MDERVEGEAERREGGWSTECRAVCQNDTLQRAALQSRLALNTFHPPLQSVETTLRRRGQRQRLRRTNYSTTILRPSAPRLSHPPSPLSFSLSLSPFPLPTYPPTIPHPTVALPRTYNLHHHAQPIQRLTFSLHSLGPLTLSISLFSSLTLRLDSLFLARPLLRHHLQPYISLSFSLPPFTLSLSLLVSRFIARSLASRPSSRPRAHQYCLPLSHPCTIVLFWLVVV